MVALPSVRRPTPGDTLSFSSRSETSSTDAILVPIVSTERLLQQNCVFPPPHVHAKTNGRWPSPPPVLVDANRTSVARRFRSRACAGSAMKYITSSPPWEYPTLPATKLCHTLVDRPPKIVKNMLLEIEIVSSSLSTINHRVENVSALRDSHEAERCAMLRALVVTYSSRAAARENNLAPPPSSFENSKLKTLASSFIGCRVPTAKL
mmetsp:Transcript_8684/g.21528  ORF Transcript_8684/g.21528 Transcript_8684/m.21528 type:complete len:207 (-) Transcript_8684:274-894(-)